MTGNQLGDFDYRLPPGRIAQQPAEPRDQARLLVSRGSGIEDRRCHELDRILTSDDLLVINDTRVFPARLVGHKPTGGRCQILLLRPLSADQQQWQALIDSNKPVRIGQTIQIGTTMVATVTGQWADSFQLQLTPMADSGAGEISAIIEQHGVMPLPPYIASSGAEADRQHYQTVFARHRGAVAAPTAGLHFTPQLLARLASAGIETASVTLHVGVGTFRPVRHEDINQHVMHQEWGQIDAATAERLNQWRGRGKRIVAVGTTTTRVLETALDAEGRWQPWQGETSLFIRPGYRFRAIDALMTNFHLPRSTLLMLVAAFIGFERFQRDYQHAIERGYRFYSYGDASLLYP
ncbi:MAG: tRNA preQ1(34) S-adenosylmethionine ribosyltransferase-isomerase QueA [Magnetococcales bacterium]|nr:tRNA preQ1(34) S-adenosylmethionine ribosyltransferase-isomerase QueA [Magnetococcales bacterium]